MEVRPAALLICLMAGSQPSGAPPSSQIPLGTPAPRGRRARVAFALSLISQPTGGRCGAVCARAALGGASGEGYHPRRLGLTLRLHDLLPLFLLCLLHQELGALGLLLGCGGRESGSQGCEAAGTQSRLPASSDAVA